MALPKIIAARRLVVTGFGKFSIPRGYITTREMHEKIHKEYGVATKVPYEKLGMINGLKILRDGRRKLIIVPENSTEKYLALSGHKATGGLKKLGLLKRKLAGLNAEIGEIDYEKKPDDWNALKSRIDSTMNEIRTLEDKFSKKDFKIKVRKEFR